MRGEEQIRHNITKTCLYNFDSLKPFFYIVKLEFTGVYTIFIISAEKHSLWVLVRTASAASDLGMHRLPISHKRDARLIWVKPILNYPNLTLHDNAVDCLCWGLTTRQPLWVTLCRLPEKGRREIEELVEEMQKRDRGEEEQE